MRFNDFCAAVIVAGAPLAARIARQRMNLRIRSFVADQARLRARYRIASDTPITGYDDATRARVRALAASDARVRLATTSGTTGAPKEIAYPRERVASYRRDSFQIGMCAFARYRVQRPGFFVLASLQKDASFASLVLLERERPRHAPPYFASLVEPARNMGHPALAPLIAEHGVTAARLWLMLVTDPGMLYATNPSTVAAFFTEVHDRWTEVTALVRRHVDGSAPALDAVMERAGLGDARSRLERVAHAAAPVPVPIMLPGLRAWVAWDGGYVGTFLPEVHKHLPPAHIPQLPMYAMSTETIETLTVFDDDGAPRFLPLGPGVLYEMLPEGAPDEPACLIAPGAMKPGDVASMVVSDPWGLVRYQTEDLFECRALLGGLPDLRFLRRRGVAYSFTGEKLTGEQLATAFVTLRDRFPVLSSGVELALFPAAGDAPVPHYQLVLAHSGETAPTVPLPDVARALDEALAAANAEFAAKTASGRLGPTKACAVGWTRLAAALDTRTTGDAARANRAWESQFKLQPLMRTRWETVAPRL